MKTAAWCAVALTCCGAAPASSYAGTYFVTQTCGAWSPQNNSPATIAVFTECPYLTVRHVGGPFSATATQEGRWEFSAPSGAAVQDVVLSGNLLGQDGWQATVLASDGRVLDTCPGPTCPGGAKSFGNVTFNIASAPGLVMRLRCGADRCPNGEGLKGGAMILDAKITVADSTPPWGDITGGDLLNGWRRGVGSVAFDHDDNVGVRSDRILVDGTTRGETGRACTDGLRIPCPHGPGTLQLDTTRVSDGVHTMRVEAVDSAGNVNGHDRTIYVDNTAPAAPLDFTSDPASGWRATNSFALVWRNPAQAHAPIAGASFEACPATNAPDQSRGCEPGSRSLDGLSRIGDLTVPGEGAWRVRLWLRDAAGNHDRATAGETTLRFDATPPRLVFREQDASDPALLRLDASDSVSGVDHADIEARRRGDENWQPLAVERTDEGFAARIDDETLRRGVYDLRARAVDRAGNERSTTTRTNGHAAVLKLPLRIRTRLDVGRRGRLRCQGHGRHRHCRRQLVHRPSVAFGHAARLLGRLRSRGKPLGGVPVEVWSQVDVPGAPAQRIARLRSSRNGLIRFRAPRGPARTLRFRYPGNALLRGTNAEVELRVRGSSTMQVSRHDAVNGEYVTFRGQVRGRPQPAGGKLVELQVFTRRRWRTFAQPRANPRTGRWAFDYRFEAIHGKIKLRFRARIRREAGYPFHLGTSKSVHVTVRGI